MRYIKIIQHSLHGKLSVMIKKQGDKFYLIVSCDEVPLEPLAKTGKTIGIDLGLNSFITADDGTKFHHPKPYKTAKEKLAFLNQKLARKLKGSNNRKSVQKQLAKAYEKVSNIRHDFLHKAANLRAYYFTRLKGLVE
jgi:putative transposase